jgi:non-ribosomal peptide synthetase component F
MERILHLWKHLVLQLAVANDAHLLSAIDTVSSKDKSSLNLWNSSEPAPVSGLAHDRVAFWSSQQPNNPAVCSWDGALTYAELDELSSRLAKFLVELNPGTVICLHLIKGLPLIISIVTIMKSGRAFLPLDIDAPPERIQSILSQLK